MEAHMSYHLRPAITTEAKPLIGLYSESGNGKTKSALLLAKGFCQDMSMVGMIETESGRGEVYAGDPIVGGYQVVPIRENFSPKEYRKALTEVENGKMIVLIIDSASHEWEGAGGVLGMAANNQAEGKKGILVWQQPKMDHQREFVLPLLQTPISLVIVCMRAKYPMKETIKDGKKDWTRSEVLEPKQSEDILFEMMVHGWIDAQHRLHVTKYTTDDFRKIFIDKEPITIDTGTRLAKWASGKGKTKEDIDAEMEVFKKESEKLFVISHDGLIAAKTIAELIGEWKVINKEKKNLLPEHFADLERIKNERKQKLEEVKNA
jgi:hypothetical protein